jgi:hypothetical protein
MNRDSGERICRRYAAYLPPSGVLLNSNSRWRVTDPLPPSAALPLREGENKSSHVSHVAGGNLPLVRGRRERSEREGVAHTSS